jgi:protein-S-isoprenylcysteine O-methyltransferase Ste14
MGTRIEPLVQTAIFLLLVTVVLFGSAGRLDIVAFWLYLDVIAAASIGGRILTRLGLIDPTLSQERMRPGGHRPGTRLILAALVPLVHWVIAGLDRGRFHWSDTVPVWLKTVALLLFADGCATVLWAMQANRFFSSVVRLQTDRGHRLVDDGPYGFVRHPGYAAGIVLCFASGIALGSWLATAVGVLAVPLLLWRTVGEDRFLYANLEGYRDYAARVRFRLVPGLW